MDDDDDDDDDGEVFVDVFPLLLFFPRVVSCANARAIVQKREKRTEESFLSKIFFFSFFLNSNLGSYLKKGRGWYETKISPVSVFLHY